MSIKHGKEVFSKLVFVSINISFEYLFICTEAEPTCKTCIDNSDIEFKKQVKIYKYKILSNLVQNLSIGSIYQLLDHLYLL